MNRAQNFAAALFVITLSACHATTPAAPIAQTAGKDDQAKTGSSTGTPDLNAKNINQDASKAHNLTEKGKGIATDSTDLQEIFRVTARSGDSLTFALKGAEAKRLYDALQLSELDTMIDKIAGKRKTGPAVSCTKCECDPAKKPELDYACTFVLDSKLGKISAELAATPASKAQQTATAIVPNVSGTNPSPRFKIPFMYSEATSGPANIEYYIIGIYTVPSNKAASDCPNKKADST